MEAGVSLTLLPALEMLPPTWMLCPDSIGSCCLILLYLALFFLVIDSWKTTLFIKRHGGKMDLGQRESRGQRSRARKSGGRGETVVRMHCRREELIFNRIFLKADTRN